LIVVVAKQLLIAQFMMKRLLLFSFLLLILGSIAEEVAAQSDSIPPRPLTKRERDYLAYQDYVATVNRVSKMSREEKNTMNECPLHNSNKEMPLSDNYRANASDYTTCYEYPFAYQLNYRRYCRTCTRIMAKEYGSQMPKISRASAATFERCSVHNVQLKGNPDYDRIQYERNPAAETPHAKQYLFKYYCKSCTKIVKAQE
jgi:hypothetical protein